MHIAEQFPARLRYTGSSLAYTLAGFLAGGLAPTMFALFDKGMKNDWLIGARVLGAQVFTLLGLALSRRIIDDVD